MICRSLF